MSRVVDFALVGLVPLGHGGDLHVADQRQVGLETADEIAGHDLHMIEIELDAQVRRADLAHDVGGMLDAAEEIVGPVARVERLDQ